MKISIGSGTNVTKVTVNTGANVAFAPATDRSPTAKITIGTGGGGGAESALAYNQANAAYLQANTASNTANGAYAQANGAYAQANGAYEQANGAYAQANGAYAQANGAYEQANGAYSQANLSYSQANAAYDAANTRVLRAGDTMTGNLNVAAWLITQNVIPSGNNLYNLGGPEYRFKDLYIGGNTVYIGDAVLSAEGSEVRTNTFNATVSFVSGGLNVLNQANAAYDAANNAGSIAINAYGQANAAYNQANAAYAEANLKLNLTGGTINGSLNVSGNLSITGNTTYYNVTTYSVDDSLIYLAANNETSDLVDIGFMGGKNTAGQYSHTGLARDAGDGIWYLFDNLLDEGHENNVVDFANTTLATLRANIEANSITLMGNVVATQANLILAYDQANTARNTANDAYSVANGSYDQANTARNTANDAYTQANTATGIGQNALGTAYGAYEQANNARNQANTARDQANTSRDQANTARTQANNAYAQANAAYADSNNRVLKSGDTMTGALTITTAGIGLTVANANVTGNLNVGTQIVTGGASGDISGVNTIYAGTFSTGTINVTAQAANAYDQANSARNQANTAYGQGNAAYTQANSARDQANTARNTANDAYGAANTALTIGQNAYGQANTARNTANDAYGQANTARDNSNSAYNQANNAYNAANNATVRVSANSGTPITSNTFVFNNSGSIAVTVTQNGANANISFSSTGGGVEYSYNTTTSSIETVDSFPSATYRSAKYQMQVEGFYGFAALEIMLLHDGNSANLIEFGKTTMGGNVGIFTADVDSGNVRLRFTGTDDTSFLTFYKSLLLSRGSESLPTDLMTGTNIYDLMLSFAISPTDLNA